MQYQENSNIKEICFAGGCFWGVEAYFDAIKGVMETTVGYANGITQNPSYYDIGRTGHAEAVNIIYDKNIVSLTDLLECFFKIVDPTSLNKQGNDVGIQYRTGIYYSDESDKEIIENFIKQLQKLYEKPIVTEVKELENYYLAEEYHQKYLLKNPNGYCHINISNLEEKYRK